MSILRTADDPKTDPRLTHCRQEEFLIRSVFQLMVPNNLVGGATKSTVRPGGGGENLNDARSIDPK